MEGPDHDIHSRALSALHGLGVGERPEMVVGTLGFIIRGPRSKVARQMIGETQTMLSNLDQITLKAHGLGLPRPAAPGVLDHAIAERLLVGYGLQLSRGGLGRVITSPLPISLSESFSWIPGFSCALMVGRAGADECAYCLLVDPGAAT